YPNAGLPNPLSVTGYDETPEMTSSLLREFAESGFINIVGGCCGPPPDPHRAAARAGEGLPPRQPAPPSPHTRLAGLETLTITPESNFIMIGERNNVTGAKKFARLI